MKYCSKCGSEVSETDNFCTQCGSSLRQPEELYEETTAESLQNNEPETETSNIKNLLNKNVYNLPQKDNSFLILSVLALISIICIAHILHTPSKEKTSDNKTKTKTESNITQNTKKDIKIDFKPYLVYRQENQGIYVFKIKKEKFNKNAFLKYAQTLPKSPKGNSNFIFVFDKNVKTTPIDGMVATPPYNIPLYTTDILWKQNPYFYYSDAFGIKQSYCEITGLNQKYYERNKGLLYDETTFSHKYNLTAPKGFGLSSLNGCNPEYVADSYTIQQEMTLSTIAGMNLYDNSQNNIKKDGLKNLANEKNDTQNFSDNSNIQRQEYFHENKETNLESDSPVINTNISNNSSHSLKRYMDNVQKRIKMNWLPPRSNDSSTVTIIFTVAKDGSLIGEPTIKQTSGIDDLDKSCINAVKLTAPFMPIPDEIQQDSVDIEFNFDYNVK